MNKQAKLIEEGWKNYLAQRKLSPILEPIIGDSWERCRYNQIDPFDSLTDCRVLTEEELRARREQRRVLLNNSSPFLETLYRIVEGSGFMVILTDEQGWVLEMLGDHEIVENTSHLNFGPGSNWSEELRGTNAIGTAIVERRPIQVYATEHYCQSLHHLTCSASPIYDCNNVMIGVLDVTGPYQNAHPHTLGMVASAVEAIEKQIANKAATDNVVSAYSKLNTIIESMSEGLVSVNQYGVIKHINTVAAGLLNTEPKNCVGKTLADLFGENSLLEQALKNKEEFDGKELMVNAAKGRAPLICSAKLFKDTKGRSGIIATFNEQKRVHRLVSEIAGNQARFSFKDVVGPSEEIQKVIILAKKVARNDSTVLIQGESGTGKEIFAQAIHSHSRREDEPFIAINCAAIPRSLVESELFGYVDGAFTGGRKGGRPGKLELANGGTIFLDEIGDMPLEIQGSLLRFLQERRITRIGGHKSIPLDVRVIAATHKNIIQEVDKGNFRLDLYYRLNVVRLNLPSLRERKDDVIPLVEYFLHRLSLQMGKPEPVISEEALWMLQDYDWPGNIRELENMVEQVMNIMEGKVLTVTHLPEVLKKPYCSHLEVMTGGLLKENEANLIKQAIQICDGNLTESAKFLGIGRATLYRKLKKLGSSS
ncbi:MAG: sigma-54-dependent Fis family transcriptional regulator [Thermincolia bacterium]